MSLRQKAGKSLSWRMHGTATTMIISYIFTGSAQIAGSIAGVSMAVKFVLYMYHEKLWELLDARGYSL
ncbi:MAG: DUF2061 domain-containing protein [Candidatus Nanohaloarchaea archaeon]